MGLAECARKRAEHLALNAAHPWHQLEYGAHVIGTLPRLPRLCLCAARSRVVRTRLEKRIDRCGVLAEEEVLAHLVVARGGLAEALHAKVVDEAAARQCRQRCLHLG